MYRVKNAKKIVRCFVCGKKSWHRRFTAIDRQFPIKARYTVGRCTGCGLGAVLPTPSRKQLDRHYPSIDYYTHKANKGLNVIFRIRKFLIKHSVGPSIFNTLLRTVIPLPSIPTFTKTSKLLDIGCGDGETLELLGALGWNVYGLDIDPHAVAQAKNRGLKHIRLGSFRKLASYPDHSFDVIRIYHVIEHLDRPDICLKLCQKKLKKGGELLIGTPNINGLIARFSGTYWFNLDIPRHIFLFTPSSLTRLLEKEGFHVRSIRYASGGGLVGTLQYVFSEILGTRIYVLGQYWLMILFYPVDWILDVFHMGDVIVVSAHV